MRGAVCVGRSEIIDTARHVLRLGQPLPQTHGVPSSLRWVRHAAREGTLLPLLAMTWLSGCETAPAPATTSAANGSAQEVRSDAAPGAQETRTLANAASAQADAGAAANEWREFVRNDDVPVCLFNDWLEWQKAEFLHQVKPNVSLRANHAINFGVFGRGCAGAACVRDINLQCWTELEGSTIKLFSRYTGSEKPGATCSSDCAVVSAHCFSPLLPKGTYEVVHGSERWKLRVPSVVRTACLKK
jgi:hypothetical protein